MAYASFDDNFADHPKNAGLSDAAFRLHVAGILYSARHLTDGLIPGDEVPRLVRRYRKTTLRELVDRGMWVSVLGGGAYEIHDYLQWNLSRDQIAERKTKAAERKARWQAARDAERERERDV